MLSIHIDKSPEFDGLWSNESGSFIGELAFRQVDRERVHETESDVAVLTDLRIAANLQRISGKRAAAGQGQPGDSGLPARHATHLDVQFRLLQLQVFFLAPRLLRLLHGGHGVDLNHAVVDDLVAIVFPVDANLQRLPYETTPVILELVLTEKPLLYILFKTFSILLKDSIRERKK